MSALAKLYAARGMTVGADGIPERGNSVTLTTISADLATIARRKEGVEARRVSEPKEPEVVHSNAKVSDVFDFPSALDMLETVNSGFMDVFSRLQKAEALRDQLVSECENQDRRIQQCSIEIEDLRNHCNEVENQNADIAEKLISETSRASNFEQRAAIAEHALAEAQRRISEVEEVCKTLHDGIHAVFGVGTPTQKVLSSLSELGRSR